MKYSKCLKYPKRFGEVQPEPEDAFSYFIFGEQTVTAAVRRLVILCSCTIAAVAHKLLIKMTA